MKLAFCLLALTFAIFGHTAEKPYFIYGDIQALSGYPMIGAGIRVQKGIHAFDISGNICPLNPPKSLNLYHLRSLYLVYPNQRGFYCGAGMGILNDPETIKLSESFESAVGFQWNTQIFLEANAIVPFKKTTMTNQATGENYTIYAWPGLTFGYGF